MTAVKWGQGRRFYAGALIFGARLQCGAVILRYAIHTYIHTYTHTENASMQRKHDLPQLGQRKMLLFGHHCPAEHCIASSIHISE